MGYNRSKSKTSRRVKRAKTNKRNNKRKQTFRKSRRVNRGGKGPQKPSYATSNVKSANQTMKEHAPQPNSLEAKAVQKQKNNNNDPHNQAKIAHENENDKKNEMKRVANVSKDLYRRPDGSGEVVDQTEQTEITEMQNILSNDINLETHGENGELEENMPQFGGKKKRATRRK